jgi:hypothetical protein
MNQKTVEWISEIDDLSYEQLRIEFMRMSPTYQFMTYWADVPTYTGREFAKKIEKQPALNIKRGFYSKGTTKLSAVQIKQLESMFDEVISAYGDYGDINKPYLTWWDEQGHLIFDTPSNKATVRDLGTLDTSNLSSTIAGVSNSMKSLANARDSRLHIVLSVPMFMTHKDAVTQVSNLLKNNLLSLKNQPRVRKQLHGIRHRDKPLLKKLKLMMFKCFYPDETMLQLGIRANISPYNETIISNKTGLYTAEDIASAKRRIGLSASRALTTAEFIAERAARDKFPDPRRTVSLDFDWELNRKNLLKAWPALKG